MTIAHLAEVEVITRVTPGSVVENDDWDAPPRACAVSTKLPRRS